MELQHTLRCVVRGLPHLVTGGVPPERAGEDRLAFRRLGLEPSRGLSLTSDDFADGGPIPRLHAADGAGSPPPLRWSGVPASTGSLALVAEDPDAPTPNPFVHWIVHRIPPEADSVAAALSRGALQGRNSMLRSGWAPCAPPKRDEPHRYVFQLFALDGDLPVPTRPGRSALVAALRSRVIACATLVGTYRR
jgi:Raf kinase inhibitor-like YbhB/YbcL family protein